MQILSGRNNGSVSALMERMPARGGHPRGRAVGGRRIGESFPCKTGSPDFYAPLALCVVGDCKHEVADLACKFRRTVQNELASLQGIQHVSRAEQDP